MVSPPEKFCLKFNDFENNITSSYHDVRINQDFSDVTLVCEDDQQIEAHRVILSASSLFFQRVLKKNIHSHPMLFLRGMKSKDMVAILDFIYQGEVNILQEDLDTFMSMAEEFDLKGLSEGSIDNSTNNTKEEPIPNQSQPQEIIQIFNEEPSPNMYELSSNMYLPSLYEPNKPISTYKTVLREYEKSVLIPLNYIEELDEQISSMMTKLEVGTGWKCTLCGKIDRKKDHISDHIESNHIEGVSHPCNKCGKVIKSRCALRQHKSKMCKANLPK